MHVYNIYKIQSNPLKGVEVMRSRASKNIKSYNFKTNKARTLIFIPKLDLLDVFRPYQFQIDIFIKKEVMSLRALETRDSNFLLFDV